MGNRGLLRKIRKNAIIISVIVRRSIAGLMLTVMLAGCSQQSVPPTVAVHAAETALRWAVYLMRGGGVASRPTALLGTYTASYLAQGVSLSRSALVGVQQQINLFFEKAAQQNESYQILQDLGSALGVNVQDLLNRSPSRAKDLDTYVEALRILTAAAERQEAATDSKAKDADAVLRAKRKILSDLQRTLSTATRQKDYVTAGSLQDPISTAQQEVSKAEADVKEFRNLLSLYRDVLKVAAIRTTALVANREVLIAGVKVVDVPGISDIGVVQGNPSRLRNAGGGTFGL
jgi:hypothetical protein